jgi:hypothetical protein
MSRTALSEAIRLSGIEEGCWSDGTEYDIKFEGFGVRWGGIPSSRLCKNVVFQLTNRRKTKSQANIARCSAPSRVITQAIGTYTKVYSILEMNNRNKAEQISVTWWHAFFPLF